MAANAAEDDPRTAAEETTDAKAAGTETIEAATDVPPMEASETVAATAGSEAVTVETMATDVPPTEANGTVAATAGSEAVTEETAATDVPPTEASGTVAATAGSEAVTEEQVAMASAVDEALNAVGRPTEASVAPRASAQVTHTTDHPEILEHPVRLNARKIEWTWFHECRIALPQCA